MKRALFLDRDGVINRERPDYVKSWDEFEFLQGVISSLELLACLPWPILVVTNQSAIGRGLVRMETVDYIHSCLQRLTAATGGRIDRFYVCPHRPEDHCDCRKPKPGLLRQAAADYDLDLTQCIFIGDSVTDATAAQAVGARCILVNTGRQAHTLPSLFAQKLHVTLLPDLPTAASLILYEQGIIPYGRLTRNAV
jgi:D-glycero-D-manno-heptose 1,7-bisphosphate phosphatase